MGEYAAAVLFLQSCVARLNDTVANKTIDANEAEAKLAQVIFPSSDAIVRRCNALAT
jgi:hypothetical protein